jgi:hypothetical protein
MTTARIERMTRELQAEPSEQFVESLLKVAERLWPRNGTPAKSGISCTPGTPVQA